MRRTLQALRQTLHTLLDRRPTAHPRDRRAVTDELIEFRAEELGGTRPVMMSTDGGRDQVATTIARTGWRSFERPLPQVLAAIASQADGAIYDVGANTGFYALLARHVNPRVAVRAFEPYPPVLELLERNVALNDDEVDVVASAVGREPGLAALYVPEQGHGLVETSASLDPGFKKGEHGDVVEVEVTTLDRFNAEHGHEAVSLVKVDVEGMEHAVLSGAAALIARHRPWLVVEVLPTSDMGALESHRARLDYVDVQLHADRASIADGVAFAPTAWNHIWVPSSDVDALTALLQKCQLRPHHTGD
jgi:FkbM family methyltransferase